MPTQRMNCSRGRLERALRRHEFHLAYQPILPLRSELPHRFEALARWAGPRGVFIPPARFIPSLAAAGLALDFTAYVLARAAEDWSQWHRAGHHVGVAVNVWPRVVEDDRFVSVVADAIRAGLDPSALTLELLEFGDLTDRRFEAGVRTLRGMGVRLSLDDFGRGDASLARLQADYFHEMKIDRSFVSRMSTDRASRAIVCFAISLGHFLGMEVVGEGVEDADALEDLVDLGADYAQGYAIARPEPTVDPSRDAAAPFR